MPFKPMDVEKLYARDDKLKREDVQILQEWLKKTPHLPELEDMQLAVFLHSCYYRIELAKITIDTYFTMRTHHPEIFKFLPEDALKKALSVAFISILPKTTPEGHVIIMMTLHDFRTENYNFCALVTIVDMVSILYMHQHGFENGMLVLFDAKGFTLGHLARFNLNVLKHSLVQVQEGAPVRIKGIHFINIGSILDKIMAMIKPLVKSELYNMVQFHPSIDSLAKSVPLECLPEDYGGQIPSLQILKEQNLKNLLGNTDFFKWHDTQKVDESKRIGKSKNWDFGTEGTFKKMQID